ncbi:MAG: protein kinase [Lentisphaeraceae bacterium]|nr:protein kinase [Lentisphaeraceae bacterium]
MSTVILPKDESLIDYIKIQCHKCESRLELKKVSPLSKVECPECSTELRIPKQIGDLLLEQKINTDENFTFYRGTDLRLNRPAVIKAVNKELTDPDEIYSFGIGAFSHENISSIYSVDIQDGTYYLITENIIGQTLEHYLRVDDEFEADDILGIAQHVAEALKVAAENNINHGHLSLDAIWVSTEGDCKVADFGIRHRLYSQSLDGVEQIIKNSIYFKDGLSTPEEIDLYSFGVCLHKLAVGEFPINGMAVLENSIMPAFFNKIIQDLLKGNISTFEELERRIENPEEDQKEEAVEESPVSISPAPKAAQVKISPSNTPAAKSPRSNKSQTVKINGLKRKLLFSRLLFAAVLLLSFMFASSRYLPDTALGKFSESLLNNTLDKAFAKDEPENQFDGVMDLLEK